MQNKIHINNWIRFVILGGFCWGTSYYWIKIAIREISPLTLVTLRVAIAAIFCWIWVIISKIDVRLPNRIIFNISIIAIFNTVIPFTLISWGETQIDSGLTGLLTASVPLFTVIIAHIFVKDDKITALKLTGLLIGFAGILLLFTQDFNFTNIKNSTQGQLAVIIATFCYSISSIFNRLKLKHIDPMLVATIALSISTIILLISTFIIESPILFPRTLSTWTSILWLGIIGTSIAYPLMFRLIHEWGPTRATLVTYIIPITAIALGTIALDEILTWRMIAGGILILFGVGIVNFHSWQYMLKNNNN